MSQLIKLLIGVNAHTRLRENANLMQLDGTNYNARCFDTYNGSSAKSALTVQSHL